MPREIRNIYFTAQELHRAMGEFIARSQAPLPTGTLDSLTFEPGKDPALVIRRHELGSDLPRQLTFREAEVAAALILFCRNHKTPLPKECRKRLIKQDNGAALIIEKSWDIE